MNSKTWLKIWVVTLAMLGLFVFFPTSHGYALPEVENIASGEAEFITIDPQSLVVNALDKTIINYKSFDIGENESVTFNLPNASNEVLNRVTGSNMSDLLGKLSCNGIFMLVNENGIYVGPNANITAAGLVLSTRDITNENFLASNYVFARMSKEQLDTLLINKGTINVTQGGFGVLIAGAVENQGTIIAPLGTIAMAGGDKVTLNIAGKGLISIAIDEATANKVYDIFGNPVTAQLKNTGTLQANGGTVLLAAEALPGLFEMAINLEGYVRAEMLESKDGTVKLVSSGKVVVNADLSTTRLIIGDADKAMPEVIELTSGTLTAEKAVEIYKTGDIHLTSSMLNDPYITLQGDGIKVAYLRTANLILQATGTINSDPGVIVQANQVKLLARYFGTTEVPLEIDANYTYLNRTYGAFDILQSTGLGTSIMLRGPPEGFGAIIYHRNTNLTLQAEKIRVLGAEPTYFYGNITFYNFESISPRGKYFYFEADKTYTFKGSTHIEGKGGIYNVYLVSQTPGQPWYIEVEPGNYKLAFVRVSDSYNLGKEAIYAHPGANDGNNTNWRLNTVSWTGEAAFNGGEGYDEWSDSYTSGGTTYYNFSTWPIPVNDKDILFSSAVSVYNSSDVDNSYSIWSLTLDDSWSGTLNLGSNTLTVSGGVTIETGNIFNFSNGTIAFGATATYSFVDSPIPGTIQFTATRSIAGANFTNLKIDSNVTLTITGILLTITNGILDIDGTLDLTNSGTGLDIGNSALDNSGLIKIGNTAPSLGTITNMGNWNFTVATSGVFGASAQKPYTNLTLSAASGNYATFESINVSGDFELTNEAATFNLGSNNFLVTGTLTNNGTIKLVGDNSDVTDIASGTVQYTGTDTYASLPAGYSYENLTLAAGIYNLGTNGLSVSGTFVNNGTVKVAASGNLTIATTTIPGTIQFTATRSIAGANFTNLTVDNGVTLTINDGTTLDVDGTLSNSGTIIVGNATLALPAGEVGNFKFTATNTIPAKNYSTLEVDAASGIFTAATGTLHANQLTITSGTLAMGANTLTADALSNTGLITVSTGDVSGIPTGSVGSFKFTDANTLPARTYANLEISACGKEMHFTAGSTTTITGLLTITGAAGNLISLRSSADGTQWKIDPQGTLDISYVDVQDSYNLSAVYLDPTGSVDSGNNTGWFTPTPVNPVTPTQGEEATRATDSVTPSMDNILQTINFAPTQIAFAQNIYLASGSELVAMLEVAPAALPSAGAPAIAATEPVKDTVPAAEESVKETTQTAEEETDSDKNKEEARKKRESEEGTRQATPETPETQEDAVTLSPG